MKKLLSRYSYLLLMAACFITSCVDMPSSREVHLVDSLNAAAYHQRYVDVKASARLAVQALQHCTMYSTGRAEAYNNLAFCYYIWMNFNRAEQMYNEVHKISRNETELLIADIGLMKIYQRTAMNEAFYEKRNEARRHIKRIEQDSYRNMSPHETQRVQFASSEFYIATAIYYYYLRQHDEADAAMNSIKPDWLAGDSCQWLYYQYVKGWAYLCQGTLHEQQKMDCFDVLFDTWKASSRLKVIYFEANSLQSLADMFTSNEDYYFFKERKEYMLRQIYTPVDTLLPLRMAQLSLDMFRKYQDPYQITSSYVSTALYYNIHGRYRDALNELSAAMQCVNNHHLKYYPKSPPSTLLVPYAPNDTTNREIRWVSREKTKTVPEWISEIREQLSVAYAGLDNKPASDYNRNAYLDIMNYTRQDKELENRYNTLQQELKKLNTLFLALLSATFVVAFLLWFFNKRARERDKAHTIRLREVLAECRRITTYTSQEAEDKLAEVRSALPRNKEDRAMSQVLIPYLTWVIDNRKTLSILSEEHTRLDKERYLSEEHIIENKRQNMTKKACLSIVNGINPYIDRILNEVRKLQSPGFTSDEAVRRERLLYIDELVTTINEYNEILTQWIKMKQGSISLNIESFELNELFALVEKGRHTFEMRNQQFTVDPTDAVVRADKALTLFMINTLAENARKYTPEGGSVHIFAKSEERYVEISVEDTGRGLSQEDIGKIIGEKVYDSSQIGLHDNGDAETLKKSKGFGFGLMNCKGIIEKYRKTNALFDVCLFNIESTVGKGSRFFFRIPKGVRQTLFALLLLVVPFAMQGCRQDDELKAHDAMIDSIAKIEKQPGFENLLDSASHYADMCYYANVYGQYRNALVFADSAIFCLNSHYRKYARHPRNFMKLVSDTPPAEIDWWDSMFDSDFHIILDVRNESAVAFLALKQLEGYRYNNEAYTSLYKLSAEDNTLGEYCRHLQRSATDKTLELSIAIFLIIVAALGYYFFFVRKRIINRMNLEQVFAINETVLKASSLHTEGTNRDSVQSVVDTLAQVPRNIVDASFDAINELVPIERLGLAVYSPMLKTPVFVCNPVLTDRPPQVQECFDARKIVAVDNHKYFPLLVDTVEGQQCVGVLYIEVREGMDLGSDVLLVQLVAEYMAIVVLNSILNLVSNYQDIESVYEELDRASYEDSQLHVQNMVLDNCLSTIKHETIYYPNKIKQIVSRINEDEAKNADSESITSISELIEYYRGIFTILNSCAARQLEEVTFRRSIVSVASLAEYAIRYFGKRNKQGEALSFSVESCEEEVVGDSILLHYLLELLIDEALTEPSPGKLLLRVRKDGDFVRFDFIDTRRTYTEDELNEMFYPRRDKLDFLICRQIIREHDEYAGHRGCRINAEPSEGGYAVYFTLTRKITQ